jgi:putative phosphonate metabolism protein
MSEFRRYAVYVVPEGPLFAEASAWLGWDNVQGCSVSHPDVADLPGSIEDLTATPRKYGFHGTIKPPFHLAEGMTFDGLDKAARDFCATRSPVTLSPLKIRRLGTFVAMTPAAPSAPLADLAATTVRTLDPFRAPASEAELAKRRKAGLTSAQEALLQTWGYPYVMEEFRFHLTLTGRTQHADVVRDALVAHFADVVRPRLMINTLALMGEDAKGMFHLIHRYPLAG